MGGVPGAGGDRRLGFVVAGAGVSERDAMALAREVAYQIEATRQLGRDGHDRDRRSMAIDRTENIVAAIAITWCEGQPQTGFRLRAIPLRIEKVALEVRTRYARRSCRAILANMFGGLEKLVQAVRRAGDRRR